MEEKPKSRMSSEILIGLAAVIASIAIPLAQFLVGYYENHTALLQNQRIENDKRRFEITKLFMENYVGKSTGIQLATIQIMKSLDPTFFISIENGLKEATKSDTVRASIRQATVEAATELGNDPTIRTKNKKVQRVMSSKALEAQGLEWVSKGDFNKAKESFQQANKEYKTYDNMEEFMKKHDNDFSSGLNREERNKLKEFYKKGGFQKTDGFPSSGFTEIK